ncbi:MAG: class I SAM-dependent RNA methyltransferase, partial [Pseudomonadota bacterium]
QISLAQAAQAHRLARLAWNGEIIATRETPLQEFDGIAVVPPPGAFLQATREGEMALRAAVLEIVGDASSVVDLFAGCGTFSLPLARKAAVHAVEGSGDMLAALDHGWRAGTGLRKVTTETRDLFRNPVSADDLGRFDAAVIDPPRAGAASQVAELAAAKIATVAMVSCNPVSFARDAAALVAAGFQMRWVQVVDQFRWSTHVEIVAAFTRD